MKMPTEQPVSLAKNESAVSLPVIVALVLALLAVAGGLYYAWTLSQNPALDPFLDQTRPSLETNREPETPTATAQIESLGALSTSDELVAIEADLEATLLDSLETELLQIEAELGADF